MSHIAPGGDDERHAPEAADEEEPPPVERDAGRRTQEEQRPAMPQGEPARESEWGFLMAALELCAVAGCGGDDDSISPERAAQTSVATLV